MDKLNKNNGVRGITLIALVITIIVLLILAGISISMLSGNNSILNQAVNAKSSSEIGKEKEIILLAYNSIIMDKMEKGESNNITEEFNNAIKKYDANASATSDNKKIIITLSNGNKYTLYNNGNITQYSQTPYAKDELVVTVSGENVDSPYYVNYPSAKGTIKCRVLYNDNSYGLQIISINPVTSIKLGKNDPNENITGEMGTFERAQSSYNRAITTLNEKAEEYIETSSGSVLATDARCVGSNPKNKNYPDNLKGNEREKQMYIADEEYTYMSEYDGKFFYDDKNYVTDMDRLKKIRADRFFDNTNGDYYWLASRRVYPDSNINRFGICGSNKFGSMASMNLFNIQNTGQLHFFDQNNAFRPVFVLSSKVKIISGEGTEEIPFEIGI